MKIISNDGKDFETVEECIAYEDKLNKRERIERERVSKLNAEKDTRYNEIHNLYSSLIEKIKSYENDYDTYVTVEGYDSRPSRPRIIWL